MKRPVRIFFSLSLAAALLALPFTAQAACSGAASSPTEQCGSQTVSSCMTGDCSNADAGKCDNAAACNKDNTTANKGVCATKNNGQNCDKNDCSKNDCVTNNCSKNDCSTNNCSKNNCGTNDCDKNAVNCSENTGCNSSLNILCRLANLLCSGQNCSKYDNNCSGISDILSNWQFLQYLDGGNIKTTAGDQLADADELCLQVVELVNEQRQAAGLQPLTADPQLFEAAYIRGEEIMTLFSHTRPNGESCFTVLSENNIAYMAAGENIALGQTSAEKVMTDWLNSEGHRANIMSDSYSRIGVAAIPNTNGSGYAWVQIFAN